MIALRWTPPPPPAVSCCSSSAYTYPPSSTRYYRDSTTTAITAFAANCSKLSRFRQKVKAALQPAAALQEDDDEEEEDFQVLTAVQTSYNHIVIVDTPKSRLLLLDSTRNDSPIPNCWLLIMTACVSFSPLSSCR